MAWSGSGTYTRTNGTNTGSTTWADDAADGTKITAANHDTHDEDLATAINACLTKNNETKPTAHFEPNADATYDLGQSDAQWKDGYFSGTVYGESFKQEVSVETATHDATFTTVMVLDDTIPQNTEGEEVFTLAITPGNTGNILLIDIDAHVAKNGAGTIIGALFQDATADALAATYESDAGGAFVTNMRLSHRMAAGTTSATTFKFRIGPVTSGTVSLNGDSGSRRFGGVLISRMTIREIKA